jgi:Zn-dependent protease
MTFYGDDVVTRRAPRGAFRPSPIFLGILVLFVAASLMAWTGVGNDGVNVFLMVVAGWLLSLCLHEFAHALVAYRSGDRGIADRGYLQLNPLKYAHWLLSIALPLLFIIAGGIALPGGAVLVDHQHIRSRWKDTAISLAGPAVNLLFVLALVAPFAAGADVTVHSTFWAGAAYLAFLQLMAGIFNLLPIPGLDGAGAIFPWLSPQWKRGFNTVAPFGFLIVLLLLWQSSIGQSMVNWIAEVLVRLGVSDYSIVYGQDLFRFWVAD